MDSNDIEYMITTPVADTSGCTNVSLPILVHGSLFIAICIIVALAFLEKRRRKWLDRCDGRPGVVIPINLLDDFHNRWSYACSFGAMINAIGTLFIAPEAFAGVDATYTKVFLTLIYAVEVSVAYFPFFACLLTNYRLVGAITGGLYAAAWFIVILVMTIECRIREINSFPVLFFHIPTLVFIGVVVVKFSFVAYHSIKKKEYLLDPKPADEVTAQFQLDCVKHVMNRHKYPVDQSEPVGFKAKLKHFIRTYIWEKYPYFRFSTRIMCTMFVAALITYEIGLGWFTLNTRIFHFLNHQSEAFYNRTGLGHNVTDVFELYINMTEVGFVILALMALVIVTFDIGIILAKYRTNLMQLYRGDYSFIPKKFDETSSGIMRFCMVFPGYQIAYKIWGILILVFVLWFFILIIIMIIVFSISYDTVYVLSTLAELVLIPGGVSLGLRFLQQALCHFFFLQDKINEDDTGKPLAVQNRRLYHIVNYFFFIANIPLGLFSSLLRIIRSTFWGLVFLGRLDRCVLPPGFETQDKGYLSYICMLLVEHTHNNPILRVFCQHLLWSIRNNSSFDNMIYGSTEDIQGFEEFADNNGSSYISKARKRWHLYYTLIHNPDIIALRKQHLGQKDVTKDSTSKIMKIIKYGVQGILGVSGDKQANNKAVPSVSSDIKLIVANQHQEKQKAGLDQNSVEHSTNVSNPFQRTDTITNPSGIYCDVGY